MYIRLNPYEPNSVGLIVVALNFIKENHLPQDKSKMRDFFNKRTAEQILVDGYVTGCHDTSVIFTALCRNAGLKTMYVEAVAKTWLESPISERMIKGHSFVEVAGMLVDPSNQIIYLDPSRVRDWVFVGKEKEIVDFGFHSYEDLPKKCWMFKEQYRKEKGLL